MNVLPVITRELRLQARQPFTFRLRVLAVLALVATCAIFLWDSPNRQNIGAILFALLHCVLFYATLLLVTFSAADSLSRERREGTLGLLCLTPLRTTDIVIAKGLAHGLRALTLLLAVIPVFALPILLGGVSGAQLINSLLLLLSAVALALGAAFLASAWSKRWTRSQAGALLFVILGWLGLTAGVAALLFSQAARGNTNFGFRGGFDYSWLMSISIVSGGISRWNWIGRTTGASANSLVIAQAAGLSLIWLLGCIWLAARHTKKVWREEPASARRQWVERKLTTPVVGLQFYRLWMRRLLDRNPVGWLERRSWQGRLVMWTWLAIVVTITTSTLGDSTLVHAFSSLQQFLAWLLILSFAGTVAGSFRRERENGVLELLLISPLSARRIILGRLRGLWGQFLPAVVLFVFVWGYISMLLTYQGVFSQIAGFLLTFVTIPIIGLYFSLRCQSFIGAFLMTLVTGVVLPSVFANLVRILLQGMAYDDYSGRYQSDSIAWMLACAFPILLALAAWTLTHSRLEQRRFSFERVTA